MVRKKLQKDQETIMGKKLQLTSWYKLHKGKKKNTVNKVKKDMEKMFEICIRGRGLQLYYKKSKLTKWVKKQT